MDQNATQQPMNPQHLKGGTDSTPATPEVQEVNEDLKKVVETEVLDI